jgi:hypothetical protein
MDGPVSCGQPPDRADALSDDDVDGRPLRDARAVVVRLRAGCYLTETAWLTFLEVFLPFTACTLIL